jgi:alkylhydroperoxidase family enzyme
LLALCDFAVQLTHRPADDAGPHLKTLRREGWTDSAIHDAIQVVAYFNYINRIAEAVGIDGEPEWD